MSQYTFENIIRRIANNNKDALEEFYQEYGEIIFGVAFSVCKSKSDADEVVNNVLIKVWNSAKSLTNIKNPEAWVYRVTYNFALNKIKSRDKLVGLDDGLIYEKGYEKVIDKMTFYEIIEGLNDSEKQILIFKFVQDKTFEEIASILNKPMNTIAYKYYSALKKLQKKLKNF